MQGSTPGSMLTIVKASLLGLALMLLDSRGAGRCSCGALNNNFEAGTRRGFPRPRPFEPRNGSGGVSFETSGAAMRCRI